MNNVGLMLAHYTNITPMFTIRSVSLRHNVIITPNTLRLTVRRLVGAGEARSLSYAGRAEEIIWFWGGSGGINCRRALILMNGLSVWPGRGFQSTSHQCWFNVGAALAKRVVVIPESWIPRWSAISWESIRAVTPSPPPPRSMSLRDTVWSRRDPTDMTP